MSSGMKRQLSIVCVATAAQMTILCIATEAAALWAKHIVPENGSEFEPEWIATKPEKQTLCLRFLMAAPSDPVRHQRQPRLCPEVVAPSSGTAIAILLASDFFQCR
jgi:hypothetical protein